MGKSTISMAIFNSYVSLPEGIRLKMTVKRVQEYPEVLMGQTWAPRFGCLISYPPAIKHGNGTSPINEGFDGRFL